MYVCKCMIHTYYIIIDNLKKIRQHKPNVEGKHAVASLSTKQMRRI